jgi:hypothetical protein
MEAIARHEDRYRLPGEPAETTNPDDIEHWRLVYTELLTTIDELLERPPVIYASREGRLLQTRREELVRGLEHWSARSSTQRVS